MQSKRCHDRAWNGGNGRLTMTRSADFEGARLCNPLEGPGSWPATPTWCTLQKQRVHLSSVVHGSMTLCITCLFPPLVHWKQCTHGRMHLNHQWLISKHGICLAHVTARTHASASIIAVRYSEVNGDFRTPKIRGVRFKDKKIRNVDCETLTSDSIQNVGCRGHDKCYNMRQLEGCHVRRTRILLRTED